ncbi:MAG: TIGR00366 family protein [Spirochaetes bacterium]|nr:TIGR00366 family protein [Spirochaetota bacterium]
MLVRLGEKFDGWAQRNIPDALSIALFLTVVMAVAAFLATDTPLVGIPQAWANGFWGFLGFSMQVSLGMVAGAVIFNAPIVRRGLQVLCRIPKTGRQAGAFLYITVFLLLWLNWGLGFISVPFLTKEVAAQLNKKKVKYHLPFLAAAAFAGNIAYGGSWNSVAFIQMGTVGSFSYNMQGLIPLTTSIFSSINLIVLAVLFVAGTIIFYFMHPSDSSKFIMTDLGESESISKQPDKPSAPTCFRERFEGIWVWGIFFVILWGVWFFNLMRDVGPIAIDLNVANVALICWGLLLWKYPSAYFKSFRENASAAAGVMLQFHIYAGIMGLMLFTGLVPVISDAFARISTDVMFPIMAFISTGIVNFAIPSGGGQWAVQGPVLIATAQQLGANTFLISQAFAHADSVMNLFIPFWMLPAAGLLKIQIRDIMGYTIAAGIFLVPLTGLVLTLAGFGVLPIY